MCRATHIVKHVIILGDFQAGQPDYFKHQWEHADNDERNEMAEEAPGYPLKAI
jgi:hypothetical protein